ncbi:hypothetical protein [Actinomadura sp. 3N508]|uniref:hypothetical protein n=1 Tax=Actinomadura sp. 3N508 TaxID=3375153 RepID=UPI0037BCE002
MTDAPVPGGGAPGAAPRSTVLAGACEVARLQAVPPSHAGRAPRRAPARRAAEARLRLRADDRVPDLAYGEPVPAHQPRWPTAWITGERR